MVYKNRVTLCNSLYLLSNMLPQVPLRKSTLFKLEEDLTPINLDFLLLLTIDQKQC